VNNVKKFMSRGRLKQKKLAIMTYKNLQLAAPAAREDVASPLTEITNNGGEDFSLASLVTPIKQRETENAHHQSLNPLAPISQNAEVTPASPNMLFSKKATTMSKSSRPGVSAGARIRPTAHHNNTATTVTGSASTVNLYVEGMHSIEARTQVEHALLKKEGVISFFSDIANEKIVIRTTLSVEDLYAYVWETCRMRASTVKGDYSGFKPSGYLDDSANAKGGWLWGISSLLQIIAVKNDGSNIPAPTPVKPTPAKGKAATATAGSGGNGEKGWLGSWW
jgi:hypothetical protein